MKLQPINDNIVIRLEKVKAEMTTASGIVIAGAAGQAKPDRGEVVAVGEGRITANGETVKLKVNVGEQVIFNRFAGTEIAVDDETYLIIKESDILVKIK